MPVRDEAARMAGQIAELRHAIHREPEIGLDLPKTQAKVLDALAGLPLEISTGRGLSSVTAVLRGGPRSGSGPVVLLRGDMDALPVTEETLFVPNTVGVIRDCPHPAAAQRLFEFLSAPGVSQQLVDLRALEGATLDPARAATGLKVAWDPLLRDLDSATEETKQIFLR